MANVTLAVALSSVITAIYLRTAKDAFHEQVEMRAQSLASFVSAEAVYPMLVGDEENLRRIVQSAFRDADVRSIRMVDPRGRPILVLQRPGAAGHNASSVTARAEVISTSDLLSELDTKAPGRRHLGEVEVALSLESERALLVRTVSRAIATGALALFIILIVQSVHFRQLLKPLELLAAFARQVGRGDLSQRAPVIRHDEIGEVSIAFNDMVYRLGATTVSRDYVDNIMRSMGDALLVTDRNLRIKTVNSAAVKLLGIEQADLSNRPLGSVFEHPHLLAGALEGGSTSSVHCFEDLLVDANGERVPALITASVLRNADEAVEGLVCLAQDITEQKRAQAALVTAKEAAEDANRMKSNFLANMSHELRTPLNAIINYSEMLIEDAEVAGRNQDIEDLGRIRSSGKHLLELINDVLDLSKIEAGRMEVTMETVPVDDILDEVTATCGPTARQKSTNLTLSVAPDCESIIADGKRLKQILMNLVANACKFTENGSVWITVERRTIQDGETVCFEVRDTGPGIAPEDMGRLFQSFVQVDGSHTRKHGGTGLGLAISQRLAGMMGGSIAVSSVLGQGSVFTLQLPANRDSVASQEPASRESQGSVFIVDEDPVSIETCSKMWTACGYDVERVTTEADLILQLKTGNPLLVFVNVESAHLVTDRALDTMLMRAAAPLLYHVLLDPPEAVTPAPVSMFGDRNAAELIRNGWSVLPLIALRDQSAMGNFRRVAEALARPNHELAALVQSIGAAPAPAAYPFHAPDAINSPPQS